MWVIDFLMLLALDIRYFNSPYNKTKWKLLSYSSSSISLLGSYSNWMLMMLSLSTWEGLEELRAGSSIGTCWSFMLLLESATVLAWLTCSLSVIYDNWGLLMGSILMLPFRLLFISILSWYITNDLVEDIEDALEDCCYNLRPLEQDKKSNSYIRVNTRELNKELFTM